MKLNISMFRKLFLMFVMVFSFTMIQAQQKVVTGTVTDANDGLGIPGVSVVVKGTTIGTSTDFDGRYSIKVDANSTIVYSFVGYRPQEILVGDQTQINVILGVETENLSEVMVIGYGQVKKEDATGAVAAIDADDFNKGSSASPQDLIVGKIAGVQLTSNGGAPGSGATIRIRGGSSLIANNDPLIIVDGVPLASGGVSGMRNPLNLINPQDIETFTVLKDASSTAIYGSRAANGVILITTKKGKAGAPIRFNYDMKTSVNTIAKKHDIFSASEFRELVKTKFGENSTEAKALGSNSTNWQDEIYKTSITHDHLISAGGSFKNLPFRASLGYTDAEGLLRSDKFKRYTSSLNVNPSFFGGSLKVNANLKGIYLKNDFANNGAIGSANSFDPTQPIYNKSGLFGGYFTHLNASNEPETLATKNPLALLALDSNKSDVKRAIGDISFDYTLPFLPDMRVNVKMAMDYSKTNGKVYVPEYAPFAYDSQNGGGNHGKYTQKKYTQLFESYINYNKSFNEKHKINAMVGYSWQKFYNKDFSSYNNIRNSKEPSPVEDKNEHFLVSLFSRINYSFLDKYVLTLSIRDDGSSRFGKGQKHGYFPAAAFAWKLKQESFLENIEAISQLKLRLGYGVTGQQDIGSNFPYLPVYEISDNKSQYQLGDKFYRTLRPSAYDEKIKWEETTTYNIALDYGLFNNRVNGSIDFYKKDTKDLLNTVPIPLGTNNSDKLTTNVGSLTNKGIEFNINILPIATPDFTWEFGFNLTYNKNEITKLTLNEDKDYPGITTGGISGGTGQTIQIHSVGHAINSFYVYEQVYDSKGKPIEGVYVDRNKDGIVNEKDKYRYKNAAADVFMGFNTKVNYKNWDFSLSARANLNNYVYDNIASNSVYGQIYSNGVLNNKSKRIHEAGFNTVQYHSDFYVHNASFLKLDNVTLGYTFNKIVKDKLNVRVFSTVQNVFTITDYDGIDPEVNGGIDNNAYIRPRTFILGLNVNF